MDLVHKDDVNWFLTLAETHHKFSTVGARGGAAAHADWVLVGSPVDVIGHLQLNKKDSLALVKFLLLKVDILGELKLKDFNLVKKCNMWLGEIGRGMTWGEHTVVAVWDIGEQWLAEGEILGEDFRLDGLPMFELGGV